jgi:hypothetical protein
MRLKAFYAMLLISGALHAQWQQVQLDNSDMAADLAEALTFTKYPTYPQYVQMMHQFAETYPEICRLDTFGTSEQGRLLLALKISDNVQLDEPEARFLYTATIHGNELVGYPLMLRLINYLLNGYETDTEISRLVDNLAIWINPLSNPDGTFYPDNDASVSGSVRETPSGTDMNRDYPDPAEGEADDTTGRATETKAMMAFLREHRFTVSANIHAGTEVVNYPWDHRDSLHSDDAWFRFVSREYADEVHAVDPDYMNLWEDGITNGAAWEKIYGGRQDYVTYYMEGREVTLELANAFRLGSAYLEEFWQKNERSLLNYMAQCMYGIRGQVTDFSSGEPVMARIEIPGHDSTWSVVHSRAGHGDFYRLLAEGVYELVVSATGYIPDTIPMVEVTDHSATTLNIRLVPDKTNRSQPDPVVPSVRIYPNPANQSVLIDAENLPFGEMSMVICSQDGREVYHHSLAYRGQPIEIDIRLYETGLYLVRFIMGSWTTTGKFAVVHP